MTNWMKWILIGAACLAALGLLLGALGLMMGGSLLQRSAEAGEAPAGGSAGSYRETDRGLEDLEVDWVAGRVLIEAYDGEEILLEEKSTGVLTEKTRLQYTYDGRSLEVEYWKDRVLPGRPAEGGKDLWIRIPRATAEALDSVTVNGVSAQVGLHGLKAVEADITTVSGSVVGQALSVREMDVETVSGDLTCSFTVCPGSLEMESVSGSMEIWLPEDSRFRLEHDRLSGSLQSDLPEDPGAENEISLDSLRGDLRIRVLS